MKPADIFIQEARNFRENPSLDNWRCLESAMLVYQQAYYAVPAEVDQATEEYKVNCKLREDSRTFGRLVVSKKKSNVGAI